MRLALGRKSVLFCAAFWSKRQLGLRTRHLGVDRKKSLVYNPSMFPPFPEECALKFCSIIADALDERKLFLKQNAPSSSRDSLGVMIGILVCRNSEGSEKILVTNSGSAKKLSGTFPFECTYVEPVVSPEKIEKALAPNDKKIHELTFEIEKEKSAGNSTAALEEERRKLTDQSLEKVFSLYSFHCAGKTEKSLKEICAENIKGALAPTGTGECCAPKLLSYAFKNNLVPESMCEIFYGNAKGKINRQKYPPCDERCGILLPSILGLKILYADSSIIVVNKQSGLLSVPGRGIEKQDCIVNRVRRLFPASIEQPSVHRLDMETSGLLVLAFTKEAHRNLNRQFEERTVKKTYVALVDDVLVKKGIPQEGESELYFRLDVENRPHQIWDEVYGKKAVTQWKILNVEKYKSPSGKIRNVTRVKFIPLTGRTHQLRLACADSHGFGVPIVGDTLYGKCEKGERLMLHAQTLEFTHPVSGKRMYFECPADF